MKSLAWGATMPTRQLNAKEILADIRSGVDYATLTEKYHLSVQGLQSAFKKLIAAGVLKHAELDDREPSIASQ